MNREGFKNPSFNFKREDRKQMEEYIINNRKVIVNLFDNIRDATDAYLIGFLFADGVYNKATHKRKHRIGVSSTNTEIIDFFAKHYQPTSEPKTRSPNSNLKRCIFGKLDYKLLTLSSLFSEKLEKYGVMGLKKDRLYQNVPDELFHSFLLGTFDADGAITFGYRKDRNRLWGNFLLVHQNENFLLKIKNDIHRLYGIETFLNKKGDEGCYVLKTSDRHSVYKLYSVLYGSCNSPMIHIKQKFDKYSNYVKEYQHNLT